MPTEREGAIRTLVVDDHRSYAEALGMALARAEGIECVGTVNSVVDATAQVNLLKPDVVILDWQMPDTDGVEGIGRIKSLDPSIAVILISGHAAPGLEHLAASAGAAAVLPKESSIADIVSAVRRCASGEILTSAKSASAAVGSQVSLTQRETEILWLLARGKDAPHIASELFLSVHTVRSYVKELRRKFSAGSQLEVVARARQQGLLPS
jgi:two-component system nitrate/nitrite response regulator NarL